MFASATGAVTLEMFFQSASLPLQHQKSPSPYADVARGKRNGNVRHGGRTKDATDGWLTLHRRAFRGSHAISIKITVHGSHVEFQAEATAPGRRASVHDLDVSAKN